MNQHKISEKKLFTILAIDLFSMTGLIFPAVIVRASGKQGLLALLFASAMAVLSACYFLWVTKNGELCYDGTIEKFPAVINYVITILYSLRFFLHGLFLIVVFRNLIQEVLLPGQAAWWILLPFFLLVFLTAGKDISTRGSILEVLFPFIFVPLLLVLILALFQMDYKSLPEQLWGNDFLGGMKGSSVYQIFLFYQPIEFLLFLTPCRKPEKKQKGFAVTLACVFVILVNVMIYVAAVGMFGTVRTGETLWSALYIMQSVKLPGHFVQRLDILFLVFYIFSTFALFSGYLFYSEILVVGRQKRWHKKLYPIVYLSGMYVLAVLIRDVESYYDFFISYKKWVDVPLAFLIPFLVRVFHNKSRTQQTKVSRHKKGRFASLLFLFLLTGLTGCQNKVDIEDRNYVMSLGIEPKSNQITETREEQESDRITKTEEEHGANQIKKKDASGETITENLNIIYETADLTKDSSEGGGRQEGSFVNFSGQSLAEAEEKEQQTDDKQIDYGHLKAIIIKKELLNTKWWDDLIDELEQKKEIAGTTLLFFVEESPDAYMKITNEMGTSLGEYLERMVANHKKNGIEEYTLSDLLREEAEGTHQKQVPYLEIREEKLYFSQKSWGELSMEQNSTVGQNRKKTANSLSTVAAQVLRFHIRANSDSEEDQDFKVRIKDRILPYLQNLFAKCNSKEECMEIAKNNIGQIEERVAVACAAEGDKNIGTSVYLCQESFPLKQYGSMVFPSGTYDALRIDLGEGDGANWWCMMYPSLCMVDGVVEGTTKEAQEKLEECLEAEDYDALFVQTKETGQKNKFRIKWRISEIFQQFFGEMAP